MSNLSATVSMLATKFFPSEAAFPLGASHHHVSDTPSTSTLLYTDDIALLLEKLALENRHDVSHGWAPRTLASGGVPYSTVFDAFHNMYESQVSSTPPCHSDHSVNV